MGNGADWIKSSMKVKMSSFGENVANMLGEMYAGIYHVDHRALKRVEWHNPVYICLKLRAHGLASYDFDHLTKLVVLCHDRCIRVEITALAPNLLNLLFTARKRDGESICDRMPTMEDHIESIRKYTA